MTARHDVSAPPGPTAAPPPPGWYVDPRDNSVQRYWKGETWSDLVKPLTLLVPLATLDHPLPGRVPPRWSRAVITALAVSAAIATNLGVEDVVIGWWGRDYRIFATLILWPVLVWMLPKISYRRRDVLLSLLFPPYAIWLVGKCAWRGAYLPFRDWPPRGDEAAGWLQVRHPTEPGALLYVKASPTGRNAG
jgi:hypothetical protein